MTSITTRPNRLRVQLWILRFMIALMLTGLPGVLRPEIAFQKFAWLMGYGKQPMTPLIIYLSGNAGYAYVALAALFWAISRDPSCATSRSCVSAAGSWSSPVRPISPSIYSARCRCGGC